MSKIAGRYQPPVSLLREGAAENPRMKARVGTSVGVWLAWLITRRARAAEGQNIPDVQLAVATKGGKAKREDFLIT